MIQRFVEKWELKKAMLREQWKQKMPDSYSQIVEAIIALLAEPDSWDDKWPDPERITTIDHGEYQGTKLYVIAASGYQPSTYWSVFVDYGSCSGCDAYEALTSEVPYDHKGPTPEPVLDQFMTMALHIVQGMKKIGGEE